MFGRGFNSCQTLQATCCSPLVTVCHCFSSKKRYVAFDSKLWCLSSVMNKSHFTIFHCYCILFLVDKRWKWLFGVRVRTHVYETRVECILKVSEDGMLRRICDIKNVIFFWQIKVFFSPQIKEIKTVHCLLSVYVHLLCPIEHITFLILKYVDILTKW